MVCSDSIAAPLAVADCCFIASESLSPRAQKRPSRKGLGYDAEMDGHQFYIIKNGYNGIAKAVKLRIRNIMVSLKSAPEVLAELARMVRVQRLNRGWTQADIARRAGLKLPTYIVFERSGRISLLRFLKITDVLDLMTDVSEIGQRTDQQAVRLADLMQERKRGRRT